MRIFTPIYGKSEAPERLSFLRPATTLFNFGQKTYRVEVFDAHLYLVEGDNKPNWVGIAVRVALIMTGIVPLIALAAAAIYRLANKFYEKDHLTKLPDELLDKIFKYALLDRPALQVTCKEIYSGIPPQHVMHSVALKECLRTLPFLGKNDIARSLCDVANAMLLYDVEKAQEILAQAFTKADSYSFDLDYIIKTYARFYFKKALEVGAWPENLYNQHVVADWLIQNLTKIPRSKAHYYSKIAKEKNLADLVSICKIAILLKESRLGEALKITDSLRESVQLRVNLKILETLAPEDALKRADLLLQLAESYEPERKSFLIKGLIRTCLAKHDRKRGIELAAADPFPISKRGNNICIAREFAKSDLEEAILWAEGLPENIFVLTEIAETIHETHPERAREIIEKALIESPYFEEHFVMCAGAMALIDEKRALQIAKLPKDVSVKRRAHEAILRKTGSIPLARICLNNAKRRKIWPSGLSGSDLLNLALFHSFHEIVLAMQKRSVKKANI